MVDQAAKHHSVTVSPATGFFVTGRTEVAAHDVLIRMLYGVSEKETSIIRNRKGREYGLTYYHLVQEVLKHRLFGVGSIQENHPGIEVDGCLLVAQVLR